MNQITELVFILDRSGSMHGLEKDTIGGFNSMIDKQKQEQGDALVTTILFDHEMQTLHDRISIKEIQPLTNKDYIVRGNTALLDAVGNTIAHITQIHKYIRKEDVPDNTMFVIITDGLENASRRYTHEKIKSMIEEKKAQGWEFIFIGANMDAVTEGAKMGIPAERSVNYLADEQGTDMLYQSVSASVSEMRRSQKLSNLWRKGIDNDNKKRG